MRTEETEKAGGKQCAQVNKEAERCKQAGHARHPPGLVRDGWVGSWGEELTQGTAPVVLLRGHSEAILGSGSNNCLLL